MITFACPTCRKTLQGHEDEIGHMIVCPQCRGQVQIPVPIDRGGSSSTMWIILAVVGVGFVGLLMLIVVVLGAITAFGTAANTTFTSVGPAIGPGAIVMDDEIAIEDPPETSNPAAEKVARAFLRDIKIGREENAYQRRTSPSMGQKSLPQPLQNIIL